MKEGQKERAGAERAAADGARDRPLEATKLVLEYIRVLIWPAVVLTFLVAFSPEIRDSFKRIKELGFGGASVKLATGEEAGKEAPPGVPDVWFDIRETSLHREDCERQAEVALAQSGFKEVTRGSVTYGYTERFVGAIWCGWREGLVLVTVAGPRKEGLQAEHLKVVNAFSGP